MEIILELVSQVHWMIKENYQVDSLPLATRKLVVLACEPLVPALQPSDALATAPLTALPGPQEAEHLKPQPVWGQ